MKVKVILGPEHCYSVEANIETMMFDYTSILVLAHVGRQY